MLKLKFQYFGPLLRRTDSLEQTILFSCWERLKAGGDGDDRGWDGWMASPIQWTGVWASSRRWWRTEKPRMLQSTGSQRVGTQMNNWTTTDLLCSLGDILHTIYLIPLTTLYSACCLAAQSCLTPYDPMDCSPPGSSVHGILQRRILEWVTIFFSRGIFPTRGSNLGLLHCR